MTTTKVLTSKDGKQHPVDVDVLVSQFNYTVTPADITAQGFQLNPVPNDITKVFVDIVHGVPQTIGPDFTVDIAGFLSWAGLGMNGLVISGDVLILSYKGDVP